MKILINNCILLNMFVIQTHAGTVQSLLNEFECFQNQRIFFSLTPLCSYHSMHCLCFVSITIRFIFFFYSFCRLLLIFSVCTICVLSLSSLWYLVFCERIECVEHTTSFFFIIYFWHFLLHVISLCVNKAEQNKIKNK